MLIPLGILAAAGATTTDPNYYIAALDNNATYLWANGLRLNTDKSKIYIATKDTSGVDEFVEVTTTNPVSTVISALSNLNYENYFDTLAALQPNGARFVGSRTGSTVADFFRYGTGGSIQSTHRHSSGNNIFLQGVTPKSDGGYFATYSKYNGATSRYRAFVNEFSSTGADSNERNYYVNSTHSYANSISAAENGDNIFLFWYTSTNAIITKLTSSGALWHKGYGATSLIGNLRCAAVTDGSGNHYFGVYNHIIKTDSNGAITWQKKQSTYTNFYFSDITLGADGNLYWIGGGDSGATFFGSMTTDGTQLWGRRIVFPYSSGTPFGLVQVDTANNKLFLIASGLSSATSFFAVTKANEPQVGSFTYAGNEYAITSSALSFTNGSLTNSDATVQVSSEAISFSTPTSTEPTPTLTFNELGNL